MLAIAGSGLSQKCRDAIKALGAELIILENNPNLEARVAHHADLSVLPLGNILFTHENTLSSHLRAAAEKREYEIKIIPEKLGKSYPDDILLNCLVVGKYIFARADKISRTVIGYAEEKGYTVVNVNQGYARCTACPVSDSAVITSDKAIKKAALSQGLAVLEISGGHINLDGFPYGFIGGACGVLEDKLIFAGDLKMHPDGEKITEFCKKHGITAVSLSDEHLCDVGSIFFI
ncbi:MAG: hypothetical protein E7607_08530 [Ruminococcaceae bacterium]|nr:hypothetical protein [Oscillospiraceae bacterium]